MRRFCIAVCVLAALLAVAVTSASAATPTPTIAPSLAAPGVKPAYEKKAAPGRAEEWARHFWGSAGFGEPYPETPCEGPFGKGGHNETQWACYGGFGANPDVIWQVNIDAYGEQTYHELYG